MRKRVLGIVIAVVSIALIAGYAVLIKNRLVTSVPLVEGYGDFFVIPVTIKGKTYHFMVDTGATNSCICPSAAKELDLGTTGVETTLSVVLAKEDRTVPVTEKVSCKIGSFRFLTDFAIKSVETVGVKGILGADVINRFRWLFDFEGNEVRLSETKWLPIAGKRKGDHIWTIDLDKDNLRYSAINIMLNDSVPAKFTMDTGWGFFAARDSSYTFTPEIALFIPDSTDAVFRYLNELNTISMTGYSGGESKEFLVTRGVTVNGSLAMNIVSEVDVDEYYKIFSPKGISGIVNRSLMTRHREVLYDPRGGKIVFYKSPGDKTRYSDDNTYALIKPLLEQQGGVPSAPGF